MIDQKRYREIIMDFFNGDEFFEEHGHHIWIAKHGVKEAVIPVDILIDYKHKGIEIPLMNAVGKIPEFETLTIEPPEGGQYEVAVRIWSENKWRGYMINDFDANHYLVGVNTRGH